MGLLYTTNNTTYNTTKITACSGGIYKTYKESWFERFHLNSNRADNLLSKDNTSKIVLQMVLCGDMEVIAELIDVEELDKYLEELEEGNSNE